MKPMCRLAAYLGPHKALGKLVDSPPHGLYRQSYAAKELETSVVSADGWGAAWYLDGDPVPCVYRSTLPIWGDANLRDLGRTVDSRCLLAAVRSATDPLGIAMHNTQPFRFENLSFVHNGYVEGFRATLRRAVIQNLSDEVYRSVAGDTDSEYLFAMVAERWRRATTQDAEERLIEAARGSVLELKRLARERSLKALCTLVVCDGQRLVAVRAAQGARSPTLYVRKSESSAIWFASEPLDASLSGWRAVRDESLVVAGSDGGLRELSLSESV